MVIVFWISISICNICIAFKTPVKKLAESLLDIELKSCEAILLQGFLVLFSTVCPFVPIFWLIQDADLANEMRRIKKQHKKTCREKEKLAMKENTEEMQNYVSQSLMQLDRERVKVITKQLQLSKDRAAYSHQQLLFGNCPQLVTMCILTASFAKAPVVEVQRALFATAGWTLLRSSRYLLKKEDPVSITGKVLIGIRMLLENINFLCTLFFFANPCFGLTESNTHVTNSFVYIPVLVTVSIVHLMAVVFFNIDIPELCLSALGYSGQIKGLSLRQIIAKAFSNLFFPSVGRDWDEPQGQYGTDDTRKTKNLIQKDWKRKLLEYSVVSGLYYVRNMVLMYPAFECFYWQGSAAILAVPIVLFFVCLLQILIFRLYNEKNHPWERLLKKSQKTGDVESIQENQIVDAVKAALTEQIRQRLGLPRFLQDPVELSQEAIEEGMRLLSMGTGRFEHLYYTMVADKLRESLRMEIAETRAGGGEFVLTQAEEEKIEEQIQRAVEDSRERVDQMKVMDYPLLVKEYSDAVGKTTNETVFMIIRYVLDNAGSYFNLDKEKIDETVRIVELDFAEMINRLMPEDKRNIGEYPL